MKTRLLLHQFSLRSILTLRYVAALALVALGCASASGDDVAGSSAPWNPEHRVLRPVSGKVTVSIHRFVGEELRQSSRVPYAIYRAGKRVASGETKPDGTFDLDLPPGVYSIFAGRWSSPHGFGCTSIHLVPPPEPNAQATATRLPDSIDMTLIPASDASLLLRTIVNMKRARGARTVDAEPLPLPAPQLGDLLLRGNAVPAGLAAAAGSSARIRREVLGADLGRAPFGGPWHNGHKILLAENAPLRGRFRSLTRDGTLVPLIDGRVMFIRSHQLIRQTTTDSNGAYSVSDLPDGVYSVLATDGRAIGCYTVKIETHHPAPGAASPPAFRQVTFAHADQDEDDLTSTTANPDDSEQIIDDEGRSGDGTLAGAPPAGGPGGGIGGGGDPLVAAGLGAAMGAATGFLISELTASKNR